ncbi:hypothetical protein LCM20_06325 [Halobacillus litoralis]|uniref:hypothetical protein n=1 Tax=Halobacillus litoralis TaxID=45668 RepID=UPI001CD7AD41|nr:hypothetical protein [Halobacillus litoralis]MCA0970196.1 hypothetical protein [Halobacillus litoralis]
MKRTIIIILLILNIAYIATALTDTPFRYTAPYTTGVALLLVVSLLVGGITFFQARTERHQPIFLAVSLFFISLGAAGWFAFVNYLALLIG